MVTIAVYYKSSGRPATSERVCIAFDGFLGGVTKDEYTNSNGECYFDCDSGNGTVYVKGDSVYKGNVQGRVVVYI